MKTITTVLLSATAVLFLSACGGGSSSSDTIVDDPIVDPTPDPTPSYTTLADLEFSTLNFTEYWHVLDSTLYSTMKFSNNYLYQDDGTPALVDDLSNDTEAALCQLTPPEIISWTYMCVRVFSSGAGAGYVLNIDSSGAIDGLFEYSSTGDTNEIAVGLLDSNLADAWVSGTITSDVSTVQSKVVNSEIDIQSKLSEFDSIIPQSIEQQSNSNSETVQKIDEMFNLILLKDEL